MLGTGIWTVSGIGKLEYAQPSSDARKYLIYVLF